jgi:catechol 2,3-dioxygenase-like lactoylglutathione lyase family enzyme
VELSLKRVIIFTRRMDEMAKFYRDVIGLKPLTDEAEWKEFQAGGCNLALHKGSSSVGAHPPKMVFFARDVAAARSELLRRGATLGKMKSGAGPDMCDGRDPDGNPFQISNRSDGGSPPQRERPGA